MQTEEKQAILTGLEQSNLFLIGFMGSGKTEVGKALRRLTGLPLVDMDHLIEKEQGCSIPTLFEERGEAAFRRLESDLLRRLCDARQSCDAQRLRNARKPSDTGKFSVTGRLCNTRRLCGARSLCDALKPGGAYSPLDAPSSTSFQGDGFSPTIVACGGGVAELPENVRRLRETGRTFFLHGSLALLFSRIKDDRNRPNANAKIPDEKARFQQLCALYQKREANYLCACSHLISIEEKTLEEIAREILDRLA